MRLRKRKILIIVGVLLFLGAASIPWLDRQVQEVTRNAYAVWWTADLVIEHLEKHEGSWPRNWEELRATHDLAYTGLASTNRSDGAWVAEFRPRDTIDELKERVEIDWSANPQELVTAKEPEKGPPFRVIWLKNGKSTHYRGKEPNEMILEYLRWKKQKQNEPVGSAGGSQPAEGPPR
ncbi:MAG: hypothetical protein J0M24_07375 [Verrucomicrobia bacterium]|nr:hypothetical protein [Verrucomicrobiota bacterium]